MLIQFTNNGFIFGKHSSIGLAKKKIHSGFSVTKTLTNFLANQYKILKDAVQLLKIIAN